MTIQGYNIIDNEDYKQWDDLLKRMSRKDWGARPPKRAKPLGHPVRYLWVTYDTRSEPCGTAKECSKSLRDLQQACMDGKGLLDIPYNFLIGGEGRIYSCRGWARQPPWSKRYPQYNGKRLDIGFIGRYSRDEINNRHWKGLNDVIADGIDRKYIHRDYTMKEWKNVDEVLYI